MLSAHMKRPAVAIGCEVPFLSKNALDSSSFDLTAALLLQELLRTYDFVGVGVVILTAAGRLLQCNATAERTLAEHDGIDLAPSGLLRLGLRNSTLTQALAKPLRETETLGAGEPQPLAILAVPRPSGKRPLTVLAGPCHMTSMPPDRNAETLLFMIDPEVSRKGLEQYARQVFGLTPAETDLAALLLQGKSLAECCEQMEIRRPTAASHLRRLFHKTKTKTQCQLVSVLFRRCGILCSEMRANSSPTAKLHLVTRSAGHSSPSTVQKVIQTHSFGGRH
jgi:DNA-binding CsgD family transcriptional regulator